MKLETIVSDQIWHAEHPIRFGPLQLSSRMTVVRLDDGSLWFHSPIPLDDALQRELIELGTVRYVVAPNLEHHLYFTDCMRSYPRAEGWVAPGLARKNSALANYATLDYSDGFPWADDLDSVFIEGLPAIKETAFFHKASGTLIVTDLLFCFGPANGFLNRTVARILGVYDRICMSRTMKWSIKDKTAFRASVERILEWDVKRVILAHDQIVEIDRKEILKKAFGTLGG